MNRKKIAPEMFSRSESTSTAIALGVHYINSKFMLRQDFTSVTERLTEDLNLTRQWLGIPHAKIQDDGESHLRLGVIVAATVKSGRLKGWLRTIHCIGTEVALYCPLDSLKEWTLVRLSDGRYEELSSIGRFEISQVGTLIGILLAQTPSPAKVAQSNYIDLPENSNIEICRAPPRGFFSAAHIQHISQKRSE